MKQTQGRYRRIVAAIPHSVAHMQIAPVPLSVPLMEWQRRWTDWFTDELFGQEMASLRIVKAGTSRLECDAERLECESDRIWKFAQIDRSPRIMEWMRHNAHLKNKCLSEWYRYRAEIAASLDNKPSIIVDCHSFPSDLAPDVDICIGFNDDASHPGEETLRLVSDIFAKRGYRVAFNFPYANAIAPVGLDSFSIMIEANKQTYMDEKTLEKTPGFTRLRETIAIAYQSLLE